MINKSKLRELAKGSEGQGINISQSRLWNSSQRPCSLASLPVILPQRIQFHLRLADAPDQDSRARHQSIVTTWTGDSTGFHTFKRTISLSRCLTFYIAASKEGFKRPSTPVDPIWILPESFWLGRGRNTATRRLNSPVAEAFLSRCEDQMKTKWPTNNTRRYKLGIINR